MVLKKKEMCQMIDDLAFDMVVCQLVCVIVLLLVPSGHKFEIQVIM